MSGGYIIARENFKEAKKYVLAENDPMFNLLYGLQSLTEQIESDFNAVREALAGLRAAAPQAAKSGKSKPATKPAATKAKRTASKARLSR